jgi:hypothetical protein
MQGMLTYEQLLENLKQFRGSIDPEVIFRIIGKSNQCPGCDQPLAIMCLSCQEGIHKKCEGPTRCHCWHRGLNPFISSLDIHD